MRTLVAKTKRTPRKTVKLRKNGKHKIDAASTIKAPIGVQLQRILRPQANFNWLTPQLAAITPTYIEQTLIGAMVGANVQQWELFDLMLKTWPELLACYTELVEGVMRKEIIFEPYHGEDEEPTPDAIERSKLVGCALRRMQPDQARDDCDLNGTLKDLLDGWFRGLAVSEIVWQTLNDNALGTIAAPKSTFWVHPINYGFDTTGALGLRPMRQQNGTATLTSFPFTTSSIQPLPSQLEPFPDNKFLIAMQKTSAGNVNSGALLRPLAWWWCAANFSADWLLNLAQVFGLPFRWANYDTNAPQATIDAICTMLQNMGSAGWASFPAGTTLELKDVNKTGDNSPQGDLLDRADRYARLLILGQTMSGQSMRGPGKGGQAFGVVEQDVKSERIEAAGKFVADVINQQLIPFVLALNYGDNEEAPTMRFVEDEEAGLPQAQTFKTLADAGVEIGVNFLRKTFDIPPPAEGEETIGGAPQLPQGFGGFGQQQGDTENPQETGLPNEEPESQDMAAGDAPGHHFRGNQYVKFGDYVMTPHGNGTVVAQTASHAWVSMPGGKITKIRRDYLTKIPRDNSRFPGISQSAEDERRRKLNEQLQMKLAVINEIKDDAIYTAELQRLAGIVAGDKKETPQVINVHVDAPKPNEPVNKTFSIKRADGTVIQGEIAAAEGAYAPGHPFYGNQWTTGEHGENLPIPYGTKVLFHSGEYKGATGTVRGIIARTNPGNKMEDVHHVDIEYPNGMKFNRTAISISHIQKHSTKVE